jgi:Pyruvate/2-oxoacid:ferredoxin oxidoreductase delta subunit
MKIELKYFTGTGNSLKVMKVCRDVFAGQNHTVNLSEIKVGEQLNSADITGFCFPVYSFGIPRLCRRYLKSIEPFKNKQKVFIIITAGDADESGFSIREAAGILKKKNCSVIYSGVVQMPINWTTSPKPPFPPDKEEARQIIDKAVILTERIAHDIISGTEKFHNFNFPERISKIEFYLDYIMFRYLGVSNLWRNFRVYDNCSGCGICERICPTQSINLKDNKPEWLSTCEQCMRCVNFCPNEAIYQTMGGETKGKYRYSEPGFNPLKRDNV